MLWEADIPDPSSVHDWPGALVAIVLIVCVLVVPSVLTFMNFKAQQRTHSSVREVRNTLQENNGGSSVRDYLDAIMRSLNTLKQGQTAMDKRITALEKKKKV